MLKRSVQWQQMADELVAIACKIVHMHELYLDSSRYQSMAVEKAQAQLLAMIID